MAKTKKEPVAGTNSGPSTEDRISTLETTVKSIETGIGDLTKMLKEDREARATSKVTTTQSATMTVTHENPQFPIPQEYHEIIKNTLNKEFGIQLTPMSDSPQFQFTIVVPDKYSSLTEEQKKTFGADLRSKVITYAQGVNGVKEWAERVYNSFNPEMKVLIAQHR